MLPAEDAVSVEGDPLAAILRGWKPLEHRVLEAARERFGEKAERSFGAGLNQLVQAGAVTPATAESLQGLQALRNLAVHAPDEARLAGRVPEFMAMSQAAKFSLEHDLKRNGKA